MALLHGRLAGQPKPIMTHQSEDPPSPTTTVHLASSYGGHFELAEGLAALEHLEWLGDPVKASKEDGWRRIRTALTLPVLDGSSPGPLRKGALLDVGPVEVSNDALCADIAWQSDSIAPLFPVFAGQLTVTTHGLLLDGEYAPPFGRIGLVIDGRLLHFIAGRTAQALLARIAQRLEA